MKATRVCSFPECGRIHAALGLRERDEALAKLSRSVSRSEVIRALRAADAPEDSMATDDDLLRYEGRAEAVAIMRDMLEV